MSNWRFSARLAAGFAVVIACAIIGTLTCNISMQSARSSAHLSSGVFMPALNFAAGTQESLLKARGSFTSYVWLVQQADYDSAQANLQNVRAGIQNLQKMVAENTELKVIKPELDKMPGELAAYENALKELIDLRKKNELTMEPVEAVAATGAAFGESADKIKAEISKVANASSVGTASQLSTAVFWSLGILFVGLVASIGIAWYLIKSSNRQLQEVTEQLHQGAEQLVSASAQVSNASQTLAQGTSEQAASLHETSSSTEEINSMTHKNAANAKEAARVLDEAQYNVEAANTQLDKTLHSMQSLSNTSEQVTKIIKVIDEIAFQTNILALNAAVEAARAGHAGAGFAVVADEVRNLAQRCAQAAKDTTALIESSVSETQNCNRDVELVAKSITQVVEDARRVKILVDEVSVGSIEQTKGLDHIAKAITQMEQVVQGSAAGAEEGAAAGEQLSAQAETLQHVVVCLRSFVEGSKEQEKPNHSTATNVKHVAEPKVATVAKKSSPEDWGFSQDGFKAE